jgi:hypothetical protein
MTRDEKISRGNGAKALLESQVFDEVFDTLLAETFGKFLSTGDAEADVRTDVWADGRALQRIKERLEYYISDAKMEIANAEYDSNQ